MAFFVDEVYDERLRPECLGHRPWSPTRFLLRLSRPTFRKSETPVISAAIDGHFSSGWESQLYRFILAVFQRSMLDESVPIGTVVLLDLLGDLHSDGSIQGWLQFQTRLPPYPHRNYLSYFMGAFMLAHRLLSREGPRDKLFWEEVIGEDGIITLGGVNKLENDFREMLEDNINYYPPPPISPDDPAYQLLSLWRRSHPSQPFHHLAYATSKRKRTMYAHIRVRMTIARGACT
jgi:hypothetical protein